MNGARAPLAVILVFCLKVAASVTLTESQVLWKTFHHTVNSDCSLLNDTFSSDLVTHTYKSLVLENEYLKVTLVPEYGGRILSLIYKPTGHEQLYQNPVGRPYGPQWGSFYYNWLMVWGGIFPTFPEPEHGKAWCRPWTCVITGNTPEKVSVKMSFTDSVNFKKAPSKFKYGATNITCNFEVTLAAQTSALKTSVTLVNPNGRQVPFEYWTNVSVSPGSIPGKTQCDNQTEIIGPVSEVKIDSSWPDIRKVEQNVNGDIFGFKNLRWYKNWTNDGIAYAWPVEGNFWGALNHGNNEAILRISENVKTPGLKLWAFGYNQSRGFNPETNLDYHRPFMELWAGASKQFFTPAQLPANSTMQFDECYTPCVGLAAMTHASEHAILNLATDKTSYDGSKDKNAIVSCRYIVTKPADRVTLALKFKGASNTVAIHEETKAHDSIGPFEIRDTVPVKNLCADIKRLAFELRSSTGQQLMSAEIPVSVSNAGTCAAAARAKAPSRIRSSAAAPKPRKLYTTTGAYVGETLNRNAFPLSKNGVFLLVDKQGGCIRIVRLGRR
jgi:hypothetical protein